MSDKYNLDPKTDPCEAVIALSVGQSITPRGKLEVKHFKERTYGEAQTYRLTAKGAEELRRKLHALVDQHVDSYYDFTNGV